MSPETFFIDRIRAAVSSYAKTAERMMQKRNCNTQVEDEDPDDSYKDLINAGLPCWCMSCPTLFWPSVNISFDGVLEHEGAARQVVQWAKNTVRKSQHIFGILNKYEKALRKRWAKKSTAKRKQLLGTLCPLLGNHYDRANTARLPATHRDRDLPAEGRIGLLTNTFDLDDFVEDTDSFFYHLEGCGKLYPSQRFLSDFMRTNSMATSCRGFKQPYIFGPFNITPWNYGSWQEWNDSAIHNFKAVSAPFAMVEFESQSYTVDMLFAIISGLSAGPNDVNHHDHPTFLTSTFVDDNAEPNPAPLLPLIFNARSVFLAPAPGKACLTDVHVLARAQLEDLLNDLEALRSYSSALYERMKFSRLFEEEAMGELGASKDT